MNKLNLVLIIVLVFQSSVSQSLEELINEGLNNNPKIKNYELKFNIEQEKVNEQKAFPNTDIGFGLFISEPETRVGSQNSKFSIKQIIPSFGVITSRINYASSLADVIYEDIVIEKRKLILDISATYFKLLSLYKKQEIINETIELLDYYRRLILINIENSSSTALDIYYLDIKRNNIIEKNEIIKNEIYVRLTQMSKFLDREKDDFIYLDEDLDDYNLNDFNEEYNLELHPEIIKYDKLYNSVIQSEILNQKNNNPSISIGLDYISVSKINTVDIVDNGKDIIMPMVTLSLPIFKNKYSSVSRQNKLSQNALIAEKKERLNTLNLKFEQAIKNRENSKITYQTQLQNIKRLEDIKMIILKNYENDISKFEEVLDLIEEELNLKFIMIDSIEEYYNQSTIINYLIK